MYPYALVYVTASDAVIMRVCPTVLSQHVESAKFKISENFAIKLK